MNPPSTIQFNNLPHNVAKRKIRASYDIDNLDSFHNLDNKKTKSAIIKNTNSDVTHTTASISNEDSTII